MRFISLGCLVIDYPLKSGPARGNQSKLGICLRPASSHVDGNSQLYICMLHNCSTELINNVSGNPECYCIAGLFCGRNFMHYVQKYYL